MLRFIPLFFLLVSICPVLSAKEIAVGQLVSDHLDTESSTNVAFNVRRNDVKVFDVRIELASSVSNSVGACFADIARTCPPWLFRQEWNLVKVTRRGPVASDELCRIRNDYRSFWISFR